MTDVLNNVSTIKMIDARLTSHADLVKELEMAGEQNIALRITLRSGCCVAVIPCKPYKPLSVVSVMK